MVVEGELDPRHGPRLHKRMVGAEGFEWLEAPSMGGWLTVLDVLRAETPRERERLVRAWAADVWKVWSEHHRSVRIWIDRSLR
jgi:hypothetical protein